MASGEQAKFSNITGSAAEAMVTAIFMERGWAVCSPCFHGGGMHYDLVLDRGLGLERVQVKSAARQTHGAKTEQYIKFNTGRNLNGGRTLYEYDSFDLFAIYYKVGRRVALLPAETLIAKTSGTLHFREHGSRSAKLFFDDYEIAA